MKYADLAPLVQLGVGLHVGTALLQIYGEIGMQPLNRMLARIRSLLDDHKQKEDEGVIELFEDLHDLESRYDLFKVRFFREFKKYVIVNSLVAIGLTILLIIITYKASDVLSGEFSVFLVAISVLPAPLSLAVLWIDASRQIEPLETIARTLEEKALQL